MAQLVILTPEQLVEGERKPDVRTGRRRSTERIIEAYTAVLAEGQPGYGAKVQLADGEPKVHLRHNLHAAAAALGLAVICRPRPDPARLQLRFITPEEQAARPKRSGWPKPGATAESTAGTPPEAPVADVAEPGAAPPKRTRRARATPGDATS